MSMASVLWSGVQSRQGIAQDAAGFVTIGISPQQHALGERQLVSVLPRQNVQVDVQKGLEGGLAIVDDDVVAVGMQSRLASGPRDALTDAHQAGDRVRR